MRRNADQTSNESSNNRAREMLKHVQDTMQQLQSLRRQSSILKASNVDDSPTTELFHDQPAEASALELEQVQVPLDFSSHQSSPRDPVLLEPSPVNYVSIKETLDTFLYTEEQPTANTDDMNVEMEAMVLQLRDLAKAQDQTLYSLGDEVGALADENQLLLQRNELLTTENKKLRKLVESLHQETEHLKNYILGLQRPSNFLLEINNIGNSVKAGTSPIIPTLDFGTDTDSVVVSSAAAGTDPVQQQQGSNKEFIDAWTVQSDQKNKEAKITSPDDDDEHVNGDNAITNKSNQTNSLPRFTSPDMIPCGDFAVGETKESSQKKTSSKKGFLKLFRRHRNKGKYVVN